MSQDNRNRPTPKWATWGAIILLIAVIVYSALYLGPTALMR